MFDDEYAAEIVKKFQGRPEWSRPPVYLIATAPEREQQRSWLNNALGTFPDSIRSRLVGRLEANENFFATYNELATAAILHDAGYEVDYEMEVSGRTPDLVLPKTESGPLRLIEVSTRFRTDSQRSEEQRWIELKTRVERIPVPVGMYVRSPDQSTPSPPDSAKAKRVAAQLESVLLSLPAITFNQGCVIEDYLFALAAPAPGSNAVLAVPATTGAYDADLVLNAINEKVSRYGDIALASDAALVVVLAAELQSPLSLDLLRTALRGSQAITMTLDLFGFEPITTRQIQMRQRDELIEFHPALSAVGWLTPGVDQPGTLTVFPVASAERPLALKSSGLLSVERLVPPTRAPIIN